jgi:hypothetical protein
MVKCQPHGPYSTDFAQSACRVHTCVGCVRVWVWCLCAAVNCAAWLAAGTSTSTFAFDDWEPGIVTLNRRQPAQSHSWSPAAWKAPSHSLLCAFAVAIAAVFPTAFAIAFAAAFSTSSPSRIVGAVMRRVDADADGFGDDDELLLP